MEYLSGQTLEMWIKTFAEKREAIHVDAIASMGAQLAQAIHSLHQQNTCHLDLKPANVMIVGQETAHERVVLLDFGLSCHADYPDPVRVTSRGHETRGRGFWLHFRRWIRAAGMEYKLSPLPAQQIAEVPIVMVAAPASHDEFSQMGARSGSVGSSGVLSRAGIRRCRAGFAAVCRR